MRRIAVVVAVVLAGVLTPIEATGAPPVNRYGYAVVGRAVRVEWTRPVPTTRGFRVQEVVFRRDGVYVGKLPPRPGRFIDRHAGVGEAHTYALSLAGTIRGRAVEVPAWTLRVQLPPYLVGAANRDITPSGAINTGGTGLGDGRIPLAPVVNRGGVAATRGERIRSRAIVFDDGRRAVAIASIETQGMFAAYANGPFGLSDIAARVARRVPALPADRILIAADHSHSAPDTIGAWGGVPESYLKLVADRTVEAIEEAYRVRTFASVHVGASDASDLIYNQSCSEALNQSAEPTYPGPELCATAGKDGMLRVVQARRFDGRPLATLAGFAAHATAGGGVGLHGDWPQFLSDAMAARYGGLGQAMQGAVGSVQPCRPTCAFTNPSNPGYAIADRKTAMMRNYLAHVDKALARSRAVAGPVAAAQAYIREPITSPPVALLFAGGGALGARLLRNAQPPWAVGATVRTVTSAVRVGSVLFAGYPGEGYHAIGEGIRDAVAGESEVIPLGLANDQLGYLISPAQYYPVIAAQVAVNDNTLFNVSPTIGDHVMCSDIALAGRIGFAITTPPQCEPYNALDALGDPLAGVPIGAPVLF